MQPDVRSRYDFWFYTVVQRDTCIACMLILAFNFQVSTASEFADHTLGGHVTPHNPIRIQCQVHGKVFQFQVFYQSKTTSATGKVSLPAEKLASSSHLMMNHLLERFPTCQVMCFHPLPQPPMDAVLEATENNKWRDGCQSYRKSGIFYHLGFWIGFFLLYYLCYLYRGVTVSITTYISLNLYIYIRTQVMGNGLLLQNDEYHSLALEETIYRQLVCHNHFHVGSRDFLCEVNGSCRWQWNILFGA